MNDIDQKIRREQIRLIYHQGWTLVVGASLCALIVTFFLWRSVPQYTLLMWLGAVMSSSVLRLWMLRAYMVADDSVRANPHWGPFFWIGTLTAGIIWGAWPLMFYQYYNTEFLLLISTVFAGMTAVSAASGSIYLPAFASFSFPLVLPLTIWHLLSSDDSLVLTGSLLMMFLIVNCFLAARGNRQTRDLIMARFRNHELMDRLREEKTIAENAVVAKSRFLAAASHDLRQPLHAMGLFLSSLRGRTDDPAQLEIIDDMDKSTDALNGLFNSLLDVSRLDADVVEVSPEHLSTGELFAVLRAEFTPQAAARALTLEVSQSSCHVLADPVLLERVMRNLLSNAVQYTHAGTVCVCCEPRPDKRVQLSVIDTGIGIPEYSRDEVFSEFVQLDNAERDRRKGLGLGLAIVKRLCNLMDIELALSSEPGMGTRFDLLLPEGDAALCRSSEMLPVPVSTQGCQVLVIDDEPSVLQAMRWQLEQWGFDVVAAESVRAAFKCMAGSHGPPDIIVSDYRLRGLENGVDAIAAIREFWEQPIPAVIVSGDTSPERLKEVQAGHLELLHKPVRADALWKTLAAKLPARAVPGLDDEPSMVSATAG